MFFPDCGKGPAIEMLSLTCGLNLPPEDTAVLVSASPSGPLRLVSQSSSSIVNSIIVGAF